MMTISRSRTPIRQARNASQINYLMIEAQNGECQELHLPPLTEIQGTAPIILPVRPRKILRA